MSFEYTAAATALRAVLEGRRSVKNAIFDGASGVRNVKRVYALVCETLRRAALLEAACAAVPAVHAALNADICDRALVLVLVYEVLYGAGTVKGGGVAKRLVVDNESALRVAAGAPPKAARAARAASAPSSLEETGGGGGDGARWVRVNTLIGTVKSALATLCDANAAPVGATCLSPGDAQPSSLIPYMLRLPPGSHARLALHAHGLVSSGALILQDLPSALPAHALLGLPSASRVLRTQNGEIGDVIDACAAPGNKTTQLAALLTSMTMVKMGTGGVTASGSGSGARIQPPPPPPPPQTTGGGGVKRARSEPQSNTAHRLPLVFAFDRDPDRLNLLASRIAAAGAEAVVRATCADFLSIKHDDPTYARVTSVLLDPSCSGSGMRARWGGLESGAKVDISSAGGGRGGGGVMGADLSPISSSSNLPFIYEPPPVAPRDATRVKNLAAFQTLALVHAFSFPLVRRVVFSTCSLYSAENEDVVAAALKIHNAKGPSVRSARLISALPAWPLRGVLGTLPLDEAVKCVRWDPAAAERLPGRVGNGLGETGFFVALFAIGKGDGDGEE